MNENVTIVDKIVRAVPNIIEYVQELKNLHDEELHEIVDSFNNDDNLKRVLEFISDRLNEINLKF